MPSSTLTFNDDFIVREATIDAMGIGYAFKETIEDELANGKLIEILPDWADKPEYSYLYWPRSPVMRPAARAFIDFVHVSREQRMTIGAHKIS